MRYDEGGGYDDATSGFGWICLHAVADRRRPPAPVRARDVFVNNVAGNDAKPGVRADPQSGDGPVRTLDRALRLVRHGDRIVLANTGEPYREMISLCDVGQRGYPDLPLVIQGNGATLDGTVTGGRRRVEI